MRNEAIIQATKSPAVITAVGYVKEALAGNVPTREKLHETCRHYASRLPEVQKQAVIRLAECNVVHSISFA